VILNGNWSTGLSMIISAMTTDNLVEILRTLAETPMLMAALIILTTFILEDVATIAAALLASTGYIEPKLALMALYIGIVLGDMGLYGIGRYAAGHPRAVRWVGEKRIARGRDWMHDRLVSALLSARFLPGMRLPTYIASGFLKVNFFRFAMIATVATAAWTGIFFFLIFRYGGFVIDFFGEWVWLIGVILLFNVFFLPRRLQKRAARRGSDDDQK
jgi:membrane protein DedA with SNARE-associated domain